MAGSQEFYFTPKVIDGNTYIYLQKAEYKGKTRKMRGYSLGNVKNINQIMSDLMASSETLFIGEYLLTSLFHQLRLDQVLRKGFREKGATAQQTQFLQFLMSMRVTRPFSKNALSRYFKHSYFKLLEITPHVNKFYEAMDRVTQPEEWFPQIVQQTLEKLDYQYNTVYYDTSTIHFFSQIDGFRMKGYGKTGPRGVPLVKLGVSCTEDYFPLTYSVYPGNTSDIANFKDFLTKDYPALQKEDTILSFDAGCYFFDLVLELEEKGVNYIGSADITSYKPQGDPWKVQISGREWTVQEALYTDRRVVTGYNTEHHDEAIQKIDRRIGQVVEFAQTVTGRTQASRRNKITSLINSLKLKQVLTVQEEGDNFHIAINTANLQKKKDQAKLVVLVTNQSESAKDILTHYLGRGEVERVFHYLKTPLDARPVHHWKESRIRAHFFLVMMGFLQLTALRVYLRQTYQLTLTLDQLLEDLRFATCVVLEPKSGLFLTYAGKQVSWVHSLLVDWNLPLKQGNLDMTSEIVERGP